MTSSPEEPAPAPEDVPVTGADTEPNGAGAVRRPDGEPVEHDATPDGTSEEAVLDVEGLIEQLESVTAERDGLADQVLRSAADFDNYRKRAQRDQAEAAKQAVGRFVDSLLPVLDACDAAVAQGLDGSEPIAKALLAALEQQGVTVVGTVGEAFDPNWHEAVLVEPAADGQESEVVLDVLRTGYRWEDRVLRAAMVKVTG